MNSIKRPTLNSTDITSSKSLLKFKFNNHFDFNDFDEIGALIKDTRRILNKAKISHNQTEINLTF